MGMMLTGYCCSLQYCNDRNMSYRREHTKPLFNSQSIMNVKNLNIYHCANEIFKIIKFRTPISMFELSNRAGKATLLVTPSNNFSYHGNIIWNVVRDLVKMYDLNSRTLSIKSEIKKTNFKDSA